MYWNYETVNVTLHHTDNNLYICFNGSYHHHQPSTVYSTILLLKADDGDKHHWNTCTDSQIKWYRQHQLFHNFNIGEVPQNVCICIRLQFSLGCKQHSTQYRILYFIINMTITTAIALIKPVINRSSQGTYEKALCVCVCVWGVNCFLLSSRSQCH